MSGHYSIKEVHEAGKSMFTWVIYAGNFRKIVASDRLFNRPQHALNSVKRFIRIISNAHGNPKVVYLRKVHSVSRRDRRRTVS